MYFRKIDKKNRICLPAKVRKEMGNKVVIAAEGTKYLSVYPKVRFQELIDQLQKMSMSSDEESNLKRVTLANAIEAEIDPNGRIRIPHYLKEYASIIDQEVVILGQGDYLEIWDKNSINFEKKNQKNQKDKSPQLKEATEHAILESKRSKTTEDILVERLKNAKGEAEREALLKFLSEYLNAKKIKGSERN